MKKLLTAVLFFTFSISAQADLILDLQPVRICNDGGTSCVASNFNASALKDFWLSEAGITLNILETRQFNSTQSRTMESSAEVTGFLFAAPHADPLAPNPFGGTPTLWFSEKSFAGAEQIAIVGGARGWVATGFLTESLETSFVAQAVGVMLGLNLLDPNQFPGNLMSRVLSSDTSLENLQLLGVQKNFVLQSTYLREGSLIAPVPEPETYGMMLAGLGLIGFMARRRKQKVNA